jgi:hypothetical protein
VIAEAEVLDVGGRALDFAGTPVWRGCLPAAEAITGGAVAGEVLGAAPPSALVAEPWRAALDRATACLRRNDLSGTAGALGGVGPGLTPAGDDALAGILVATRARLGAAAEDDLLEVASAVRTSALAGACLHWAARGQSIAPVHDLLGALAAGDCSAAEAALQELCRLGASSGADLALGLRLGLCPA